MEEIIQFLAGILNREFIRAVFSNPRVKDNVVKAKLRPLEQKGELLFQLESFTKTQAFHKNLTVEETKDELAKLLEEFRQVQVETQEGAGESCGSVSEQEEKIYFGRRDCGSVSSGSWSYDTGWKDCADEDG